LSRKVVFIMRIGEVAQASGASVTTVRFYEREGLLSEPMRSDGNYRVYERHHVSSLRFILHCRSLGMTLDEVRSLLKFMETPDQGCQLVNKLLDEHIAQVAEKIGQLQALKNELQRVRAKCHGADSINQCGILRELTHQA
jgi:Cd(II)/Pb(II)-responsive transcriptional regulator